MKLLRYMNTGARPECPTVASVLRYVPPVRTQDHCLEVLAAFFRDGELYALPVIDAAGAPAALIERRRFVEYFGKAFTHELYGRKSLDHFMRTVPGLVDERPLVVTAATSVDDVAAIIIDKGMQHMVSGFIVSDAGRYAGIANGHDLLNDITQRKQAELYYLAHYDQLTGLPNRMLFADRLEQACRDAARRGGPVALMFVDLDRFKQVNDSLGHSAGDQLLREVAARLRESARVCDTVARLGGDEFAVLVEVAEMQDAEQVAGRIVAAMQAPFELSGQTLFVTASIGIALYPRDDGDVGGLLAKADAAMFEKKRNGRNGFHHYVPGMNLNALDRLTLEADLRSAIDSGEFELHYQPQVCLSSGQPLGVEALVRWRHPKRGMISPAQFIELAEESGLIVRLGEWVLREACRQLRRWRDDGLPPLRMSVNVSSIQFREPHFCRTVRDIVEEAGVPADQVELELTESIVMHHAASVQATLERLKQVGVRLAIDDFGTGFSSLSYLRRFPIDRLKIDQSFVRGIEHTPVNESIVRAIAALAQSLSLEIIAEGAETEAELAVIRDCRCDEAQGYHFLRPSPAPEIADWLRARFGESRSGQDGAATGRGTAPRSAAPLHAVS